jgi:hypothetical protein
MSAGISSSTLANLVKQMRANGDNQVVLEVDGQPVTVELRPAQKAPAAKACTCLLCGPLATIGRAINRQNPRFN